MTPRYLARFCPSTGAPEIDVEVHRGGGDPDEFYAWREDALLASRAALRRHGCELAHDEFIIVDPLAGGS